MNAVEKGFKTNFILITITFVRCVFLWGTPYMIKDKLHFFQQNFTSSENTGLLIDF